MEARIYECVKNGVCAECFAEHNEKDEDGNPLFYCQSCQVNVDLAVEYYLCRKDK